MVDLVLGDNPLFGVSHAGKNSEFQTSDISSLLESAVEIGVREWMVTPHRALYTVLEDIRSKQLKILSELSLLLVYPYPHQWNEIVATGGYLRLVKELFNKELFCACLQTPFRFLRSQRPEIFADFYSGLMIGELKRLEKMGATVSTLCIHNILVDILLAAGRLDILRAIVERIKRQKLKVVILTQNPLNIGHENFGDGVSICCSVNSRGYMVNPTLDDVMNYLKNSANEYWAMQIVASGQSSVQDFKRMSLMNKLKFSKVVLGTTQLERLREAKTILDSQE